MCENVSVPKFTPKDDEEIETDENAENPKGKEEKVDASDMKQLEKEILKQLSENPSLSVAPVEFEKDDDLNHHIDMITAATNLRARCYTIKEANRLEIKRIAGNITPAIATTTSAVAGLVGLELIKLRSNAKEQKLEIYKNAFISLAISLYALSEPGPVQKNQITKKLCVSMWDRWEVKATKDCTLQEFLTTLKSKYTLNPMGIVQGSSMIYMPMPMYKKKLDLRLVDLLKPTLGSSSYDMVVTFADDNHANVEGVPTVRFTICESKKTSSKRKRTGEKDKKHKSSATDEKKSKKSKRSKETKEDSKPKREKKEKKSSDEKKEKKPKKDEGKEKKDSSKKRKEKSSLAEEPKKKNKKSTKTKQ